MKGFLILGIILLIAGFFVFWLSSIFFGLFTSGVFLIVFSRMMGRESDSQISITNSATSTLFLPVYCPSCGTKIEFKTAQCPSCGVKLRKEE
jgi:ribosomal protein S27E